MSALRGRYAGCLAALCLAGSMALHAQQPPPSGAPPFDPVALERELADFNKKPDTRGTGPYPALKEEVASLPDHVIYRPADLSGLGRLKLGVLAWGNGGCSNDGAGARMHLAEIASHGYLVIANGRIRSGPGAPPGLWQPPRPSATGSLPPPQTQAADLTQAIDWALRENKRPGGPYFRRIDPRQVAVSGWSCGGIQALQVAPDPRIKTVIIHNSGIFDPGKNRMPGMELGKEALQKIRTSIIYVLGGSTDIAYANGMDDFKRLEHVPAAVANLDVGHGGTFLQPNGGAAASVAVSWLDWQLRGDKAAAARFVGEHCGLCQDHSWTLERKNFATNQAR